MGDAQSSCSGHGSCCSLHFSLPLNSLPPQDTVRTPSFTPYNEPVKQTLQSLLCNDKIEATYYLPGFDQGAGGMINYLSIGAKSKSQYLNFYVYYKQHE